MTPEPLFFIRDMVELHGRRTAVRFLQVFMHILDGMALLIKSLGHPVVARVSVDALQLIQLPVRHFGSIQGLRPDEIRN